MRLPVCSRSFNELKPEGAVRLKENLFHCHIEDHMMAGCRCWCVRVGAHMDQRSYREAEIYSSL